MRIYPRWIYHRTEGGKVVKSEAEEKALGKGWADNPGAAEALGEEVKTGLEDLPQMTQEQSEEPDSEPKESEEKKPRKKKGK